jgi:ABC-2 type transport system permease protein
MRSPSQVFKVMRVLFAAYYAQMMEYRAELVLWALSGILPFILMGVWTEAAQNGGFGLSSLEFIRYFLAAFIVRQFNVVWVIWEFEKEVVEGRLSPKLLQPLDPGWHHFITHISERFARLPFIGVMIVVFFLLYPQAFWVPSLGSIAVTVPMVAIAFALRFLIQYTFALFAFWTERASAIEQFWFLLYLFLSGLVAPLEVFPKIVRDIILWTPFPCMVHFPSALLVGLPTVSIFQGISVMLGWGVVFWFWNRWLWREGLKRYSGMGA